MLPASANDLSDTIFVMQKLAKTASDAQKPRQSINDIMGLAATVCADKHGSDGSAAFRDRRALGGPHDHGFGSFHARVSDTQDFAKPNVIVAIAMRFTSSTGITPSDHCRRAQWKMPLADCSVLQSPRHREVPA